MKRKFADLRLQANISDPAATRKLLAKAAELDYGLVAVPLAPETLATETARLRNDCKEYGLDFASRIDLKPRTPNDLLSQLRKLRRRFEVICVLCETKEVARQAAKDRRVDLLAFPQLDHYRRFFDRAEAELASSSLATLEVSMKPLLVLEGPSRIRFLGNLRREVATATSFRLPVVLSSGVSDPLHMRKPRELAILSSLFGLSEAEGLDAVSVNPAVIVERNRLKLSDGFVAPGIRVVKEGADS